MKKLELIGLYNVLHELNYSGVEFGLAVSDNIDVCAKYVKPLEKEYKKIEAILKDYNSEKETFLKSNCIKNVDDQPIVQYDQLNQPIYKLTKEGEEIAKQILPKLKDKYKDAISKHGKEINDYNKELEKEVPEKDLKFVIIDRSKLPTDITSKHLIAIKKIIKSK